MASGNVVINGSGMKTLKTKKQETKS